MAAYTSNNAGKRTRVVAWLNQEEWQFVYDNFYSEDHELQKKALDRFAVWKSRVTTKMPLSIACTARLVEACVMEKQGGNADCIRLSYAMALIRFVNMMTDRYQNKVFAQPIHVIAQEIGIPVWIVNLRHDATHGELPSLNMLKTGVAFALSWLQTDYWEKNEDTDSSESEMDVKVQLRQLLIRYQQEQYMILQMGWSQSNEAIVEVLADISETLDNNGAATPHVFDILLQDGFLVPTTQQLQSLGVDTNNELGPCEIPQIPEVIVNLWQPLLQKLSQMKILHGILEPLCKEICKFISPMMHSALYLTKWMMLLLDKNLSGVSNKGQRFKIACSKVDWHRLFDLCVESPNPYTCHIVQRLVDYLKPPLTPQIKANIIELATVYLNQFKLQEKVEINDRDNTEEKEESGKEKTSWKPFSINEIEIKSSSNKVKLNDGEILRRCDKHCEAWQKSKADISWSEYPLGWLPGQLSHPEYLNLRLRKSDDNYKEENNNMITVLGSSQSDQQTSISSSLTTEVTKQQEIISNTPYITIY